MTPGVLTECDRSSGGCREVASSRQLGELLKPAARPRKGWVMSTKLQGLIVAGVDGSDQSLQAVRYAVQEAQRLDVGIRLVHATPETVPLGTKLPLISFRVGRPDRVHGLVDLGRRAGCRAPEAGCRHHGSPRARHQSSHGAPAQGRSCGHLVCPTSCVETEPLAPRLGTIQLTFEQGTLDALHVEALGFRGR